MHSTNTASGRLHINPPNSANRNAGAASAVSCIFLLFLCSVLRDVCLHADSMFPVPDNTESETNFVDECAAYRVN
jgi:hypothetical protein